METDLKQDLHCGACMKRFENMEELSNHIEYCLAAKTLLPFINKVHFIGDSTGHYCAHLIRNINNNIALIHRYAHGIANDMDSLWRSKLHYELCQKLDIDYNEFRPFDSPEIKKLPSKKECEVIIWEALEFELMKAFDKG